MGHWPACEVDWNASTVEKNTVSLHENRFALQVRIISQIRPPFLRTSIGYKCRGRYHEICHKIAQLRPPPHTHTLSAHYVHYNIASTLLYYVTMYHN